MAGQLRASLRPDQNSYYYLSAGVLQVSNTPYYIEDIPAEWLGTEIKIGRSKQYTGLYREYSAPIKFMGHGAELLKKIFYSKMQNASAYLQIERRGTETPGVASSLEYLPFFTCAINFNEIVINEGIGGGTVEVTLMDDSIAAKLRENEDIEYEVPITGADVIPLKLPALLLNGEANWTTVYPLPFLTDRIIQGVPITTVSSIVYLTLVDNKTLSDTVEASPATFLDDDPSFIFKAKQILYNVKITGSIAVTLENKESSSKPFTISIQEVDPLGAVTIHVIATGNVAANTKISRSDNISFTFAQVLVNHNFSLVVDFEKSFEDLFTVWEGGHNFKVSYQYLTGDITTKGALRWYKVLESVIKQATDNKAVLDLGFVTGAIAELQNSPYNTVLLSGDSVRGLNTSPYNYPVIKTTLADLFKDGYSRWGIGLSIVGNKVTVRKMEYYFNPNNIIKHLGQPSTIKKQVAKEYLFNKISVGSKAEEHDDLNGRDDAHTTQVYKMPVSRATATLDLVTPYKVSPYTIYFCWSKANNSSNVDQQSDNTIFVVDIQSGTTGGYYIPQFYPGTIIGITDTAHYYNYGETPKRFLLRHKRFLRSLLYGLDSEKVTFQTTDKNAALSTTFSGVTIDEDADIPVTQLGAPLFMPIVVDVEVAITDNIIALIDQMPDGCFVYTDEKGRDVKIFPVDAGMKWGRADKQVISGLLAPGSILE